MAFTDVSVGAGLCDTDGRTPLSLLCANHEALAADTEVLVALAHLYPKARRVQDRFGKLPVHYVAAMPHVTEVLLRLAAEHSPDRPPGAKPSRHRTRRATSVGQGAVVDNYGATPLAVLCANETVSADLVRAVSGYGALAATTEADIWRPEKLRLKS
jgi:hypothetical protein